MVLSWGIVSAGKISNDFVAGLKALSNHHRVHAIAARDYDRAKKFAEAFEIPNYYNNYESLAKDPKIDVVYIGCLNPQHYEVSKLMLENGKHVLCEKPLTLNYKQTKVLVDLARAKKLFLMEAVWSRAFPVYKELEKILKEGQIGEVIQVIVNLGFPLTEVERLKKNELGGGAILDLGVYALQFTQFVFRGLSPTKILAAGHLTEDGGVDSIVNGILVYPNNKISTIQLNSVVTLPNVATIIGTKGTIKIQNFWCPTSIILPNQEVKEFPLPKSNFSLCFINSQGLRYEAEEVRQCIEKGLTENPSITLDESLELAQMMDSLRQQVGVKYQED